MFPVSLLFYLATPIESVDVRVIQDLFPDLEWGIESDLLKHSEDWPDAVVILTDREGYEAEERCDFPVEVEFLLFPGRVARNDSVMLATKVALLRLLSATCECRVICDAKGFAENGEPQKGPAYAWVETFLCQSGRVYAGVVPHYDAREGSRPAEGWLALDDLVEATLNPDGTLRDQTSTVARLEGWIATRDVSHLRAPRHPFPPEPVDFEIPAPLTPDEIEEEIAAEFPTDEEMDREEGDWLAYTERIEAWTSGGGTTSSKQLIREGIALPPPDSLDDQALSDKLWEVIRGLARVHTYLERTDHLSDRELYTWLWEEGLNESTADLSGLDLIGGCHTSPIGSGDEESTLIGLIYYDSEMERAEWKAAFPDAEIPAHRDLPYDRDRHLPTTGYGDDIPF
jgi:hypothetical protein